MNPSDDDFNFDTILSCPRAVGIAPCVGPKRADIGQRLERVTWGGGSTSRGPTARL
jgi:hypothetical protein